MHKLVQTELSIYCGRGGFDVKFEYILVIFILGFPYKL